MKSRKKQLSNSISIVHDSRKNINVLNNPSKAEIIRELAEGEINHIKGNTRSELTSMIETDVLHINNKKKG